MWLKNGLFALCIQDRDEDRPGLGQSGSEGVFRERSRRSGEDDGEPAAGSVHTRAHAAQRSHTDHKLHHHRSAARPLVAVRTHRTEPVRRGSHTWVWMIISHMTACLDLMFSVSLQWMMSRCPAIGFWTVCTHLEPVKVFMLRGNEPSDWFAFIH